MKPYDLTALVKKGYYKFLAQKLKEGTIRGPVEVTLFSLWFLLRKLYFFRAVKIVRHAFEQLNHFP